MFGIPDRFLAFVFYTSSDIDQDTAACLSLCINNCVDLWKTITFSDEYLYITNAHTFYVCIEYNYNNKYFGIFVIQDIIKPINPLLFGKMDLSDFFKKYSTLCVDLVQVVNLVSLIKQILPKSIIITFFVCDALLTSKTIQLTKPGDRNTSSVTILDTAS